MLNRLFKFNNTVTDSFFIACKVPFNRFIRWPVDDPRFESGRKSGYNGPAGHGSGLAPDNSHLNGRKTDRPVLVTVQSRRWFFPVLSKNITTLRFVQLSVSRRLVYSFLLIQFIFQSNEVSTIS